MKGVDRGFTLVEMLAALAVFGLGCAVLLVAFGQAARTLAQVRTSDHLSLVARSLIDNQRDQSWAVGEREGTQDGVYWRLRIGREPGGANLLPLLRLDLDVREGNRNLRLSTLAVQGRPPLEAGR